MIKPYLGQCHISNCLIMSEQYVFTRERMNVIYMPKLIKKKLSSVVMVALYAGKSRNPLGKGQHLKNNHGKTNTISWCRLNIKANWHIIFNVYLYHPKLKNYSLSCLVTCKGIDFPFD